MDEAVTAGVNETLLATLAQTASTLQTAARDHKRSEGQHRKRARELMRQLDLLRAACAEHGIQLIESTDPRQEGHSDGTA